jgi:hypothetical protein
LLLTFILVSPAIFLLRKPRGGRALPEGAH